MQNVIPLLTQRKIEAIDRCGALPFVFTDDRARDYWRVASTGRYAQDCSIGRAFAREMLDCMKADVLGPTILVWVVHEMMRKGPPSSGHDGIVVGFISAIGAAAVGDAA